MSSLSLKPFAAVLALAALTASLSACNDDELPPATTACDRGVQTGNAVGLTVAGNVVTFDRMPSPTLISNCPIKGLKSGESLLALDVRPQDGLIYAVSNQGGIYTVNDTNGQATFKFALSAGPATDRSCTGGAPAAFTSLAGTNFALDFNPMADRLRLASDARQNLRINVTTGATTVDCPITFASGTGTPKPTAAAYTNSISGMTATATALFYIDTDTDMLYAIDSTGGKNANDGVLTPVGPLGFNVTDVNAFDIEGSTGTGYAIFTVGTQTAYYRVSTTTGAATALAIFSDGMQLRGLSLK